MPKNIKKAEADKRYYQRQRGNKPPKGAPKTASERMRKYRARKKALLNAVNASASTESSDIPTVASPQELLEPMEISPQHQKIEISHPSPLYVEVLPDIPIKSEIERAVSPVEMVSDPLGCQETVSLRADTASSPHPSPLHIEVVPRIPSQSDFEQAASTGVVVSDPLASQETVPLRADTAFSVTSTATATIRVRTDILKQRESSPEANTPLNHCPVVRPGPATSCNYCWQTVDKQGRTLRRKTKYHCLDCQTSLCIVPCFQEYHERHVSSSQTDPLAL